MQMAFDLHIGIDYSGAETAESRLKALQIYAAADGLPERVCAVPEEGKTHWNWSRREIAEWLIAQIQSGARIVAGIDHAFSFPLSYMERYGLRAGMPSSTTSSSTAHTQTLHLRGLRPRSRPDAHGLVQ